MRDDGTVCPDEKSLIHGMFPYAPGEKFPQVTEILFPVPFFAGLGESFSHGYGKIDGLPLIIFFTFFCCPVKVPGRTARNGDCIDYEHQEKYPQGEHNLFVCRSDNSVS
jgi:hypothetical protein